MTRYYPPLAEADLVLRSGTSKVYYTDTSTPDGVSYDLYGMSYYGCPDCGGSDVNETGNYDQCLNCGTIITLEYLEAKIIASG